VDNLPTPVHLGGPKPYAMSVREEEM
jgi:hypothetical protein